MGTIAELLGLDLPDPTPPEGGDAARFLPGTDGAVVADGDSTDGGGTDGVAPDGSRDDTSPARTCDEAVMAAVLAETTLDAGDAREDLTLVGDLDLDTIGRYSVMTSVEHELGVELRDPEVDAMGTLGDLLAAVRAATTA